MASFTELCKAIQGLLKGYAKLCTSVVNPILPLTVPLRLLLNHPLNGLTTNKCAKQIIVVIFVFLGSFGTKKLGSIAYKTGPNMYRKVEET